jgi:hypothetical protein
MRIRIVAFIGLLLCCSLVPAHGATHVDPASVISPPAGWTRETLTGSRTAALGYVLAQWFTDDRGREEFIEIGSRPSYGFTDESFGAFYQAFLKRDGQTVFAYREQPLCHGERGWYVRHRDADKFGGSNIEDVFLLDGTKVYFASYHYPKAYTAASPGRNAILSLCVPTPTVARHIVMPFKFVPPRGWLASDPRTSGEPVWPGVVVIYVDPHNFNEALALSRERLDGEDALSNSDAAGKALAQEQKSVTSVSRPVLQLQRLCGNHVGWLATYSKTYQAKKFIVEEMVLPGPITYTASYARLASIRESPQARSALATLCPLTEETPS